MAPTDTQAAPAAAGGALAASTDATAAKPGYLLCIHVAGDGKISVGVEPDQEEAAEETEAPDASADAPEPEYKPVASIAEALSMAKTIYANNGTVPENPDMAAAKEGYAKRSIGRPMMQAPNPGGVFGE